MRHPTIHTLVLLVLLAGSTLAQATLQDLQGPQAGNDYGRSVAIIGDVNNDGHADLCIGIPLDDTFNTDAGLIHLVSGQTGAILWTKGGLGGSGNQFGFSVAAAGDVNNDGTPDVIVGAPFADTNGTDNGRVEVLSGINGSNIATQDGDDSGDEFGTAVCGVGDVNSDGRDDYAIGAPKADPNGTDSGKVRVFSGLTGNAIRFINGNVGNGHLGASLASGFDANNDGVQDLIAGAPGANFIRVYSLATGALQAQRNGFGDYGASVGGVGDVNGDGFDDVIVGAPQAFGATGRVEIVSGLNGSSLGTTNGGTPDEVFGQSVAGLGDFDGNGVPDVVVGAPGEGGSPAGNLVRVLRADTLAVIATVNGLANGRLGTAVAGGGDVDNDGLPDAFAGAPSLGNGRALAFGFSPRPGTGEDLTLERSRNGAPFNGSSVSSANQGDTLRFRLESPNMGLSGGIPLILGDLILTGSPVGGAAGSLPGLQVSVVSSVFLVDGSNQIFGPAILGVGVSTPTQVVPSGLSGFSLILQGFSVTPLASNGIFASTDALEVQL